MKLFLVGDFRYPILRSYIASRARVSIIDGPLGSGKTTASCQRILLHMMEQNPNDRGVRWTRILVVRNTYPELLSTTAETFKAFFFPDEVTSRQLEDPVPRDHKLPVLGKWFGGGVEPPQALFDFELDDGTICRSQVIFRALDRPSDVRNILGSEFTWIYLSECKELDKSIVDMLTKRHGRFPSRAQGDIDCTVSGIFGDTNKCNRGHWIYEACEKQHPEGWAFFHQPGGLLEDPTGRDASGRKLWRMNPEAENLVNLPDNYYVNDLATYSEAWISVYLANEYGYVSTGKPVHPDYVDHVHCARDPLRADLTEDLVIGYDFGRTPAAVILQWWRAIGRWAALDEYATFDTSAAAFAPDFKLWLARRYPDHVKHDMVRGWGDPSGDNLGQADDETPIKILNSHGLPCLPAPTQDPLLRRSALANPLRRGTMDGGRGFILSPTCEVLRQGLQGGWCFERVLKIGVEEYRDIPAKNHFSHVCEALEYALSGEGESKQAIQHAAVRFGTREDPGQEYAEM